MTRLAHYRLLRDLREPRITAAYAAFVPGRVRIAVNALRGRPVMYRMSMEDGTVTIPAGVRGALIFECSIIRTADVPLFWDDFNIEGQPEFNGAFR